MALVQISSDPYSSITHTLRIFIIEGLIAVVAALFGYRLIVDWPAQADFLTEAEKQLLARRLASDRSDATMSHLDARALRRIFRDWKIYVGFVFSRHIYTSLP